ncbi:hypothetical protein BH20ACT17_BH20ACT17_10450 [soil metagenome]
MEQSQAQRTLVKSPPELWAELSSEDSLGRHLGEFGEIRITRVKPETTVAWEGDRASGTVQIEPTGWGTKVTLTATATGEPVGAEPEPVVEPELVAEAEPVAEPEAVMEAEPLAEPEPISPVAMISLREHDPSPRPAEDESDPVPRRFFARFFRRPTPDLAPAPTDDTAPAARAEIPTPPAPTPDPSPPTPAPDPTPPGPDPPPSPPPAPDPMPPGPGPDPVPPPSIEMPAALALDPDRTVAILTEVLDDLGAAHHRPFSRG